MYGLSRYTRGSDTMRTRKRASDFFTGTPDDFFGSWHELFPENLFKHNTMTATVQHARTSFSSVATDTGSLITVDLPGVKAEDVEVAHEAGILSIDGKRGDKTYSFRFNILDFDPSTIKASLQDGVMTIALDAQKQAPKPARTLVKFETKK